MLCVAGLAASQPPGASRGFLLGDGEQRSDMLPAGLEPATYGS